MSKSNILDHVLHSLAGAYKKQLVKYLTMEKLSRAQKKAIEEVNMEKLEDVIVSRQQIIKELEVLNNELAPLKKEIIETLKLEEFSSKAILKVVSTSGAQELDDFLGKIANVLTVIKEVDKENEALLRSKLNQVKVDLKDVQGKKQLNKAYGGMGKHQGSNFFDESK